MKMKSWRKFLLATMLTLGMTTLSVSAAQKEVVKLADGESSYKLIVDNFVDFIQLEVDGELSNVVVAEKPTQNQNGSYTLFEIQTTDKDARDIFSFVRMNGEQIGDFVREIEGSSIIYSPHIYEDFDEISKDNIFSINFYITNSNNEKTHDFTNIYFKFVEGEGSSKAPVDNTPVEVEEPLLIAEPIPVHEVVAAKTESNVSVNGKDVAFEAYNIDGYNYFKLRDLALAISGSEKQFEVTWDGEKSAINLVTGEAYTTVGGELTLSSRTGSVTATSNQSTIYVDGEEVGLQAYTIDGNNYFKLRDVAEVFDFGVAWDGILNQIGIDTTIEYIAQ